MADTNRGQHIRATGSKKPVLWILILLLILAAFMLGKVSAEAQEKPSPYDSDIVGTWQIDTIVGDGEVPEQYLDPTHMAQVTVNTDHTGVMQYGPQQTAFQWEYREHYEDGSSAYTMKFEDGRLIGAILVGANSEEYKDFQGMLGINIADDTMMAFARVQSTPQTAQAA